MITENSVLNTRYRLDKKIGQGGFAQVFLATDQLLKRRVAIKVLDSNLTEDETFLARFEQEAQSIASLEHPNILGIYDYGQAEGTAYLVMPFIEGGTLYDRLRREKKLSLSQAGLYLQQAAMALDYAHRRNIVHRDIKPQNMLLRSEDDRLLLADFGIAKVLSSASAQSRTGILGTLSYMSPEQLEGNVGISTDIYALGCVLFLMLTGQLPYVGPTEQVMMGHIMRPIPSIVERSQGQLPTALQEIIEKVLAKKPEQRYSSAGAVAKAFQEIVSGEASYNQGGYTLPIKTQVMEPRSYTQPAPTLPQPVPYQPPQATPPQPYAGHAAPTQALGYSPTPPSAHIYPSAPPPKKRDTGLMIGLAAGLVAVVAGVVLVGLLASGAFKGGATPTAVAVNTTSAATTAAPAVFTTTADPSTTAPATTFAATTAPATTLAPTLAPATTLALATTLAPVTTAPPTTAPPSPTPVYNQRQVVYTSSRGNKDAVYVYSFATNKEILLSDPNLSCFDSTLSPNGLVVAMRCVATIYTVNIDGSGFQQLVGGFNPAWSPSGDGLVFLSSANECGSRDEVFTRQNNGTVRRLTCDGEAKLGPRYSPNGSQIVYSAQINGKWQLVFISAAGNDRRVLNPAVDNARYPVWSPTGKKIAFSTGDGKGIDAQIFAIDTDGSNLIQLTDKNKGQGFNGRPRWSSDDWIIFHSNREQFDRRNSDGTPIQAIYVMKSDGSNQQPLPINSKDDNWIPEWK